MEASPSPLLKDKSPLAVLCTLCYQAAQLQQRNFRAMKNIYYYTYLSIYLFTLFTYHSLVVPPRALWLYRFFQMVFMRLLAILCIDQYWC